VVYILRCSDGTLYTGITNDLEARLKKHNAGRGAKYTRGRLPVEVCYSEQLGSKSCALKAEASLKTLTREQKLKLIKLAMIEES
jgi:putative endonuclease